MEKKSFPSQFVSAIDYGVNGSSTFSMKSWSRWVKGKGMSTVEENEIGK